MAAHLLLRLEAPLLSFGTVAVDQRRPVQPWPATSMLTGLFANALGWRREQGDLLDRLQSRILWAARIDRPGEPLDDFQTAQLAQGDKGWTTRHAVEERAGGPDSYRSPYLRNNAYRADASVLLAVRLAPADDPPTLAALSAALDAPARPLFLGRKGCLPATRIGLGLVEAEHAVAALDLQPLESAVGPHGARAGDDPPHAEVPTVYFSEGAAPAALARTTHAASNERRFAADVHAGTQRVHERPGRAAAP